MTVKVSTGAVDAIMGSVGFKAGLTAGVIYLYSGAQPATADSAVTGTLLGIVTKGGLPWVAGTSTNGLTYDGPTSGTISKPNADEWKFTGLADGVVGYARFVGNAADTGAASTTLVRLDCAIGSAGVELIMSNVSIVTGVPGNIQNFSMTHPKS